MKEAGGLEETKKEEGEIAEDKRSFAERYFGDFYTVKKKNSKGPKKDEPSPDEITEAKKKGIKPIFSISWNTYKNFKKAHRMLAW